MFSAVYRITELGDEKRCMSCGEYWPADTEFFGLRAATRDQLATRCLACAKEGRWSSVTLDAMRERVLSHC
ncbi:hypothetical protein [Janthinobacterium tructae]|uniref:hypothetical protein n=1 Tax=Janthinobacterium tructae TaxID=2590869 RepID=UPI00249AD180|nr:hypothetical protein [Janthinobacterium tructae]MDI3292316.1 hypothetical protein [Janthinobacterium tructae]